MLTSQLAAIKIAEVGLYGSEEARLAIEQGIISDALQDIVDAKMKVYIWFNRNLADTTKIPIVTVIQRMPYTYLRVDEVARVNEIINFLVGDIWNKALSNQNSLNTQESAALTELSNILLDNQNDLIVEYLSSSNDFA